MKKNLGALVALIVAALWAADPSAAVEPTYVIFAIMGPQALGSATRDGITVPEVAWHASEKESVEDMRREFGEQHAGQQRYVGFSVALMPTLNLKPDQLKAEVVRAMDLAERDGIPVFFHLDDQHFWWASPALSQNPEMQEWSDFPSAGKTHGPVVPYKYWLNWANPPAVYPAPPPCLACGAFRAALARRLQESFAEPVVQRLNTWRKQGKDYLFAGVASGNETQVPDYSRGYDGYHGRPGEAVGLDRTRDPPVEVHMSKAEMVPMGYHSLHAMGYDRQSLERLAQAQHKSLNKIVHQLLYDVAHDYAEFQAKTINQAGVPKDRIYTHFTSSARTLKAFDDRLKEAEDGASSSGAGSDNLSPPVESSVNPYSRPGFTVVRDEVDLNELVTQLRKAHSPEEGKAWAAVESYASAGQPGVMQTREQYEEYLGGLIGHGAKVVNVYGWNMDINNPYAVKRAGVVPAVKEWLAGARLPATWFRSAQGSQPARIQAKIAKLQQMAQNLADNGHDPHAVRAIFESFQSEFDPLMKAGKIDEAEAALDRAIARLRAQP